MPTAAAEAPASDPYGRLTPRGCLFGFFQAAERGNFQNAAEYLDLPPSLRGSREAIARQIQVVFDHRFVTVNMDRLSRNAVGSLDDGLPPDQEKIGEVRGDNGMIDVILVRQDRGGQEVWLISWETVRELRQLYDSLKLLDVDRLLPSVLVKTRIGAMALWQALGILLLCRFCSPFPGSSSASCSWSRACCDAGAHRKGWSPGQPRLGSRRR